MFGKSTAAAPALRNAHPRSHPSREPLRPASKGQQAWPNCPNPDAHMDGPAGTTQAGLSSTAPVAQQRMQQLHKPVTCWYSRGLQLPWYSSQKHVEVQHTTTLSNSDTSNQQPVGGDDLAGSHASWCPPDQLQQHQQPLPACELAPSGGASQRPHMAKSGIPAMGHFPVQPPAQRLLVLHGDTHNAFTKLAQHFTQ